MFHTYADSFWNEHSIKRNYPIETPGAILGGLCGQKCKYEKITVAVNIAVLFAGCCLSDPARHTINNFMVSGSSFVSFTQYFHTCGHMLLPALSLWPGRQPCRPRLVYDMRGGGPSYVAPHSCNPPTGRHRDSPISSSLFSHGPLLCAVR